MRLGIIIAATLAVTGVLAAASRGGARASVFTQPRPGIVKMVAPLGSARLTQQRAMEIAKASDFGPMLAKGSDMTVRYGSWVSGRVRTISNGHVETYPAKDVWAITVGGLNVPGHGPIGGPRGELAHFMTIIVDDATGKVEMTIVY